MSTLRQPTLGPIIGHTTDKTCNVWISASTEKDWDIRSSEDRRTIGVLAIVKKGGSLKDSNIFYFRLKREYDRSASFKVGGNWALGKNKPSALEPDTEYLVRVATLTLDDASDNDRRTGDTDLVDTLPPEKSWKNHFKNPNNYKSATIKTFKETGTDSDVSFLTGSCRYPGILWGRKNSDRIFAHMINHEVDFQILTGDQIYADKFNRHIPIGLADSYKEFQERYHTAFSSYNMSRLLNRIPTYMILDDHEIEDNWHQDRIHDKREVFNLAMHAYMSYQWSHGPRSIGNAVEGDVGGALFERKSGQIPNLYYDFQCAKLPFFVLDVRTQRYKGIKNSKVTNDGKLENNHLLGWPSLSEHEHSQLDKVVDWLIHQQETKGNVPKFIVTSSVFAPNTVSSTYGDKEKNNDDGWAAFPTTRKRILQTIVSKKIQNVIFLSGDIHCACVSKLTFTNPEIKAYSIVSSALYWPFPFADGEPSSYVHDSQDVRTPDTFKIDENNSMDYKTWGFSQADNFCRIDYKAGQSALLVQYFDKNGNKLESSKQDGRFDDEAHVLELAMGGNQ